MKVRLFTHRPPFWLLWLVIYILAFGLRIGFIFYERTRPLAARTAPPPRIEMDYLVMVPKFRVTDLASAQALVGKDLWARGSFQVDYFPLSTQLREREQSRRFLEPMERITVKRIVEYPAPHGQDREILIVFEKDSQEFATVAGCFMARLDVFRFYLDELFFPQDPRVLYSHWSSEIWQAIESHQLKPGMTFVQAPLSLGMGSFVTTEPGEAQVYRFAHQPGGQPGIVQGRFVQGRLQDFQIISPSTEPTELRKLE